MKKLSKHLLIAAAVTGALAAHPLASHAEDTGSTATPAVEKSACSGKDGCAGKGEKESCSAKDKEDNEKNACSGKDGCGGKSG